MAALAETQRTLTEIKDSVKEKSTRLKDWLDVTELCGSYYTYGAGVRSSPSLGN